MLWQNKFKCISFATFQLYNSSPPLVYSYYRYFLQTLGKSIQTRQYGIISSEVGNIDSYLKSASLCGGRDQIGGCHCRAGRRTTSLVSAWVDRNGPSIYRHGVETYIIEIVSDQLSIWIFRFEYRSTMEGINFRCYVNSWNIKGVLDYSNDFDMYFHFITVDRFGI